MKKILIMMLIALSMISGCTDQADDVQTTDTPPSADIESLPDATDRQADESPSPAPKISSDFADAPTADEISDETGINISEVLLQDTLVYEIKRGSYFAVALQEDAGKQYRWMLASDDDKFTYIVESHLNGYRVFIMEAAEVGNASLLFELSQNTTTLIETLSYQLEFLP